MSIEKQNSEFPYVRFAANRSREEARMIYDQRIKDAIHIFHKHRDSFSVRNCPFCDSPNYENAQKFHDSYGVSICNRCLSYFVNPAPSLEALDDYYNNASCNILLDNLIKKRKEKPQNFIIDDRVAKVLEYLSTLTHHSTIKILEVGCGSGSFLSKLKTLRINSKLIIAESILIKMRLSRRSMKNSISFAVRSKIILKPTLIYMTLSCILN